MSAAAARTERLWNRFFADPSIWWDKRKSKANPKAPDFKHKLTREPLWIDGWHNPIWVKDKLISYDEKGASTRAFIDCPISKENFGWKILSKSEALSCLDDGSLPELSVEDFSHILRKCRETRCDNYAFRFCCYVHGFGLETHPALSDDLVCMFVELGSLPRALQLFSKLVYPTESLLGSLITAYVKYGEPQVAIALYKKMREGDFTLPAGPPFVALIKACSKLKDLETGRELQTDDLTRGLSETDIFVGNTLMNMYVKCGLIFEAERTFNHLRIRDVVSWTALIAAYVENGHNDQALKYFERMESEGVSPDSITIIFILKACTILRATIKGQEMHSNVSKRGLLENDFLVGNAMIDMYAKCGLLAEARQVFERLPDRDVASWNVLLNGYVDNGHEIDALKYVQQMQRLGFFPDAVTFITGLRCCGIFRAIEQGNALHIEISRNGCLQEEIIIGNTLIDMYMKCGLLIRAQEVFEKLPFHTVTSCTVLLNGYVEHGCNGKALMYIKQMQQNGMPLDAMMLVSVLKACGNMGAIGKGRELHIEIVKMGLLGKDLFLASSLIGMYAECGHIYEAHEVFLELPSKGLVQWSMLIAAFAQGGLVKEAIECFGVMQLEGIHPDAVSFLTILKACCQAGLFGKGRTYYESMTMDHCIHVTPCHLACMVDLLCRMGEVNMAIAMARKSAYYSDNNSWISILNACNRLGDLGYRNAINAFQHVTQHV